MGSASVRFGPFELRQDNLLLLREGRPIAIGQHGYKLLQALVAGEGETVSKAILMEASWPGTVVEEGNLTVQIAALRKALGTRADGQDWIVTVPRLGYRLLRVTPSQLDSPSRRPSVAVLPFQNLSGDPEQEYFADGMVEDIITALSRFRNFAVVARNSSFVYKGQAVDVRDVARELGARYVLEGSVRRAAGRLRVAAQLIDGTSGSHLWARNFDGAVEDIFDMQDRITRDVVTLVEPQITEAEIERSLRKAPESLDAYDLVLRGLPKLYTVKVEDNAEAFHLFVRALQLEPAYAWALTNAAWALEFRLAMGWPSLTDDDAATCLQLVERSLEAANGDPLIYAQAGVTLANDFAQYSRGLELVMLAVDHNPNNLYTLSAASITHLHCGSLAEALRFARRCVDLTPTDAGSHWPLTAIAHAYMALGDFEEAIRWADRSFAVNANFVATFWMLMSGHAMLGQIDEAKYWLSRFRTLEPGATIASIRNAQPKRYADRMANILDGLRLAGLPEG